MLKTRVIVNMSDAQISRDPAVVLATYSLGSCIAVCLYDPQICAGGMLHYQLPESKMDDQRAKQKPLMFADTGMECMISRLIALGANKKQLHAKIAGGAAMENGPKGFDVGKRNHLAIRKILWKHGMLIEAEDVGGSSPRNMYLNIETGEVTIRTIGLEKRL
jgi:chemotaxis protein CheD